MSSRALNHVFTHSRAKTANRLVLVCIADQADDNGFAWLAQQRLANKANMTPRTLRKHLDTLEASEELLIFNRVNEADPRQHYTNVYWIILPNVSLELPQELRGRFVPRLRSQTTLEKLLKQRAGVGSKLTVGVGSKLTVGVGSKLTTEPKLEPHIKPSSPNGEGEAQKNGASHPRSTSSIKENSPDGGKRPTSVPKERMTPMKNAIKAAFGWSSPTVNEWGQIEKTARGLCMAGASPEEVAGVYAYCKGQEWGAAFKPTALLNHYSTWKVEGSGTGLAARPTQWD